MSLQHESTSQPNNTQSPFPQEMMASMLDVRTSTVIDDQHEARKVSTIEEARQELSRLRSYNVEAAKYIADKLSADNTDPDLHFVQREERQQVTTGRFGRQKRGPKQVTYRTVNGVSGWEVPQAPHSNYVHPDFCRSKFVLQSDGSLVVVLSNDAFMVHDQTQNTTVDRNNRELAPGSATYELPSQKYSKDISYDSKNKQWVEKKDNNGMSVRKVHFDTATLSDTIQGDHLDKPAYRTSVEQETDYLRQRMSAEVGLLRALDAMMQKHGIDPDAVELANAKKAAMEHSEDPDSLKVESPNSIIAFGHLGQATKEVIEAVKLRRMLKAHAEREAQKNMRQKRDRNRINPDVDPDDDADDDGIILPGAADAAVKPFSARDLVQATIDHDALDDDENMADVISDIEVDVEMKFPTARDNVEFGINYIAGIDKESGMKPDDEGTSIADLAKAMANRQQTLDQVRARDTANAQTPWNELPMDVQEKYRQQAINSSYLSARRVFEILQDLQFIDTTKDSETNLYAINETPEDMIRYKLGVRETSDDDEKA